MNLTLTRISYRSDGIFSTLADSNNNQIAIALEHAYQQQDGLYKPKLDKGVYTCVKGQHQLSSMKYQFETFEITNVVGHTNILFHQGNFNNDSEGCVLLGKSMAAYPGGEMITFSDKTFESFMQLQAKVSEFQLTVA